MRKKGCGSCLRSPLDNARQTTLSELLQTYKRLATTIPFDNATYDVVPTASDYCLERCLHRHWHHLARPFVVDTQTNFDIFVWRGRGGGSTRGRWKKLPVCGRDQCTTPAARGTSDYISIALHSRRDYGWPQRCTPTLDPAIASQLQARALALVHFEAAWRGLPAFLLERDCTNPCMVTSRCGHHHPLALRGGRRLCS